MKSYEVQYKAANERGIVIRKAIVVKAESLNDARATAHALLQAQEADYGFFIIQIAEWS